MPSHASSASADAARLDAEAEELTVAVIAASRLLIAVSTRALASIDDSMTQAQLRALMVLESCQPLKLAALAATLGVNPSTCDADGRARRGSARMTRADPVGPPARHRCRAR
ncbi:hypothetical protein [Streptomyces noursei]|uniref:hypothetical protein n=1 Tax=Streptomyces noursei TaxID=1971 RepID=UPI0030F060D1